MKSIAQFVKNRITTPADLQDALQTAMRLEFSTIPPYLCAQWSINSDPSDVADMIEGIVVQEMYHFALAGNMLTAIGGVPNIANPTFLPSYPTNVLPGGIPQKLPVDLQPLTLSPCCPRRCTDDDRCFLRHDCRRVHDGPSNDQSRCVCGQFGRSNPDQEHSRCARSDCAHQGRRRRNEWVSRPAPGR